jgi:SIR2-like protein
MTLNDQQWDDLVNLINEKICTPFIGAGASALWLPLGAEIATKWAEANNYPLEDYDDLSKVAQYLAINNPNKDLYPKRVLSQALKRVPIPNFASKENENTPYAVLADLPFSIYITTNYDYFMEEALKSKNRKPVSEFCRWNNFVRNGVRIPSVFDNEKNYTPSAPEPLVYHLHGVTDVPQSMVLTEIDYMDFILNLNSDFTFSNTEKESKMIPSTIKIALVSTSLLFIGYKLRDMNFRLMFRNIVNYVGEAALWPNVAVLKPQNNKLSAESQNKAQEYISQYTNNMFRANVYWGDGSEFSKDLRSHWDRFNSSKK